MQYDESYVRKLINQVKWTWAKTYVTVPHEYIVRGRCGLTNVEFEYLVHAQREYGIPEQWHKYNFPYLYIDGYKYWTMGDAVENTTIINRQKVFSEFDSIDIVEEKQSPELMDRVCSLFFYAFYDQDVYEVGCGTGATLRRFAIGPSRYRGIDPSKKAIEQFRLNYPEWSDCVYCKSFEESVNYWIKGDAVVLATFGAASYFMRPYLEILANSGKDYFLMFYKEDYCPESFKSMHHFIYTESDIKTIFPKGYIYHLDNYCLLSSHALNEMIAAMDLYAKHIPEEVITEAKKHGIRPQDVIFNTITDRGLLFTEDRHCGKGLDMGATGLPCYLYYKDGKVEVEDLREIYVKPNFKK